MRGSLRHPPSCDNRTPPSRPRIIARTRSMAPPPDVPSPGAATSRKLQLSGAIVKGCASERCHVFARTAVAGESRIKRPRLELLLADLMPEGDTIGPLRVDAAGGGLHKDNPLISRGGLGRPPHGVRKWRFIGPGAAAAHDVAVADRRRRKPDD